MKIRWSTFDSICREFSTATDGASYWIEDADGKHVAGHAAYGDDVTQLNLDDEDPEAGRLLCAEKDSPALGEVVLAMCRREYQHQMTVADMADATARLWRQTNALLRMSGGTNLALEPSAMLERILRVLAHSTGLGRGGGYVRQPGEGRYRSVGLPGSPRIEQERVRVLDKIEDDVRLLTDCEADHDAMGECEVLFHNRAPLAVARIATDEDHYGMLLIPVDEPDEVRADDLKLLSAAAQILSIAIENAHTLSREREAARLQVENELLATQARDMEEMVHIVAHDLRSPMTALYGFVHVALDALEQLQTRMAKLDPAQAVPSSENIAEPLEHGVRSIEKLNRMVQRLLDFSRVARMDYNFEPLVLDKLVAGVLESLGFQIKERGISVETESLPMVEGDRVLLESVFRNLIDNAIKYMGDSEPKAIRIGCFDDDGNVYFIEDTGVGMDADQASKAFLPFRRFHADAAPGEGIGLPYVRKIVERHGGQVWCESTEGVGTTFFFRLGTNQVGVMTG